MDWNESFLSLPLSVSSVYKFYTYIFYTIKMLGIVQMKLEKLEATCRMNEQWDKMWKEQGEKSQVSQWSGMLYYIDLHLYTYAICSIHFFLFPFQCLFKIESSIEFVIYILLIDYTELCHVFHSLSLSFFLFFFVASASQRDSSSSKDNSPGAYGSNKQNALDMDAFKIGPYFDKAASKNVTALLGKTAYLNCRVKQLSERNKTVSVLHKYHISTRWERIPM